MNNKTKNLVGVGLFTAIVVVLQFLGGGIRFTMFSITLVLVPLVVGSAVYGWKAGAWLGFAFGVTVAVVLIKGIFCGLTAGLVYKLLSKWSKIVAVFAAAVTCPVVNTGIFLIGSRLFFWEKIGEWATQMGFPNATEYAIFGLAGINFLIEIGVNIVLAPMIVRLIKIGKN